MTTNLQRQLEATVQSSTKQDRELGIGLLFNMARAGEIISPWWSRQRDMELVRFLHGSDHVQGSFWMIAAKIVNVPYRVIPRDRGVKRHVKLADQYQAILDDMVNFGQGWQEFWFRFLLDLWSTDNGGFGEVLGDGDPTGPIEGPAYGLAHLDSLRCVRTSNPEYPVIYQDVDGRRYRFHHTRVIYKSQSPSSRAEMNGVGHCWLTRCVNNAQRLVDKDVYFQEQMGSRPLRQMLLGRGVSRDDLVYAVQQADEGMDNRGLRRFSKTIFVGDPDRTDIGIDSIPFTLLPDGFDEDETTRIAMATIALAGGFPLRWIWPAGGVTGATKADALYQHIAGQGGGAQWHLETMRTLLSYSEKAGAIAPMLPQKFLPKELKLQFDFQDDEQDRQQAEIKDQRAGTRKTDIDDGVIDIRTAREQALDAGDITQAQFNRMELESGRLPNGDDVLTMYDSTDPLISELLDLGVDEPLLLDANDPLEMIIEIESAALATQERMVQAGSQKEREKLQQALAALSKLKTLYESIVGQEIEQELVQENQEEASPPGEKQEAETEQEEKAVLVDESVVSLFSSCQGEQETKAALQGFAHGLRDTKIKQYELFRLFASENWHKELDVEQRQSILKGFDFGVGVGQRIRGKLFRGEGGRFASEGEVAEIQNEFLRRLIERLRAKRQSTGKGGKKTGKKPKKGGGGKKKPKKTPEQLKREKRAKKQAEMNKVFGNGLAAKMNMERNEIFVLENAVLDGAPIDKTEAVKFAQLGLMEFDSTGEPFVTAAGRSIILNAARGDIGGATSALARGKARVERVSKRADKKRDQAERTRKRAVELQERAEDAMSDADELADDAQDLLEQAEAEQDTDKAEKLRERAEKLQERADKKREQAEKLQERAGEQDERANDLDNEANQLDRSVGAISEEAETEPAEQTEQATEPTKQPASQAEQQATFDLFNEVVAGTLADIKPDDLQRLVEVGLFEIIDGKPKLTEAGKNAFKEREILTKAISDFRDSIRAAIRGLWTGRQTQSDFVFNMVAALEKHLVDSWNAGAAICGIAADELTEREIEARSNFINEQFPYLPGFAGDIAENSKNNGGKLQPQLDRGELWIGRYEESRQRGQAMACANKKLKWILGEAEHCKSCLRLNGKVRRAAWWHSSGILPRVAGAPYLECRGYNCQCQLVPTNEPATRGRFPGLP